MRNLPLIGAALFLFLAVSRTAVFIAVGISGGHWAGWIGGFLFSVGVALGLAASSYRMAFKQGWWIALASTVLFMAVDLYFNEAELIRVLSVSQMIAPQANFLGWEAKTLTGIVQAAALVYGAFQTVATALLGWLQGTAAQVPELNKPGVWARIRSGIYRVISGYSVAVAIRIEQHAEYVSQNAARPAAKPPEIAAPRHWGELTAEDVNQIVAQNRQWIMATYGISDGAAGAWKRWIREGKRPWITVVK